MGTTPQELMEDIRRTRADLAQDVDQLADRLSPKQAAKRGVGRVGSRLQSVRDTVMGSVSDTVTGTAEATAATAHRVEGVGADVVSTLGELAPRARRQTTGNPLAAGVIAFGAGMLAAALLPKTSREQQLAGEVRDKAQELGEPLKGEIGEVARSIVDDVRPAVQEAVTSVKESAQEGAHEVAQEVRSDQPTGP